MGFWLSWDVEDNVKMQVFVDNAAAAPKDSPPLPPLLHSGLPECQPRHGSKRKLEEEETEEEMTKFEMGLMRNNKGRQKIFNISMDLLNKFKQCSDPSLRRSVLICNTLRTIEREMVGEGLSPCPPVTLLPSIETDKMTLEPFPPPGTSTTGGVGIITTTSNGSSSSCISSNGHECSSSPSYFGGGNAVVVTVVEPVPCRDNELGYEKSLTDLDSVSGRATPYPSSNVIINNNSNVHHMWDSDSSSSNSSSCSSPVTDRLSTTGISWSSVLSFPSQNELVTTSSSVSDDVWPTSNNFFEPEANNGGGGSGGGSSSGSPNTSPSASSDSGISTASDEIFGDIDLSLYDFDLLPLSPPNIRAAPPSAEELLRSFPPTGQSIQLTSPSSCCSSSLHLNGASSTSPLNAVRHTRSYEAMCEDYEHGMHLMPAPP